MNIDEIIEELKYYNGVLPKEALREAVSKKEEITPKLLEMLEYTKNNLEDIVSEKDGFFGYTYAFFLLAEFREKKAFPYLIELLYESDEVLEFIIGEDYTDYLSRLLASTYNGDDEALLKVINNKDLNVYARCCAQNAYAILYLNGVKSEDFIIDFYKKQIDKFKLEFDKEDIDFYRDIACILCDLKMKDFAKDIDAMLKMTVEDEERKDLMDDLLDGKPLNFDTFPINPLYKFIDNTIEIMEMWQAFRYQEDEEFESSRDYEYCMAVINKRSSKKITKTDDMDDEIAKMIDNIDQMICKAYWYDKRDEVNKALENFKFSWLYVVIICKQLGIKSIKEYDEKFRGFDFLLNWFQTYSELLNNSDDPKRLYEKIQIWEDLESIFDLNKESELYWKENSIRERANSEFRLGHEEDATKIIEDYLKIKPDFVWGYVEMADWYLFEPNKNLEKALEILLRGEKIDGMSDKDCIFERISDIYRELGDEKKAKEYDDKWEKYVSKQS